MNISIITFTENGTKLAEKIRQAFADAKMEEAKNLDYRYLTGQDSSLQRKMPLL